MRADAAVAERVEPFDNVCGPGSAQPARGDDYAPVVEWTERRGNGGAKNGGNGENGLLVADEREMAAALDSLFDSPDVARRLGQQGAAVTRTRWTMAAAISRLETHLYRACERGAGLPR